MNNEPHGERKTKVEPWASGKKVSRAKTYLKLQLENENSWVRRIIDSDPMMSSKTIDQIHGCHHLFRQYDVVKFRSNFKSLKKSIDKTASAVRFDQNAFEKELSKYQKEPHLKTGYPRWNHTNNEAKKLLEDDIKSQNRKPKELYKLRPEYQRFPEAVFRNRYYRERRKQTEQPFWVLKRNNRMRKKTTENEMEALIVLEQGLADL